MRSRKGFTLIEILVAILVLLIGLLGYYSLLATVARSRHYAHRLGEASLAAKSKLEELKSEDYDNVTSGNDNWTSDTPLYLRVWEVNEIPGQDIKNVKVKVGWGGEDCLHNLDSCRHRLELESSVFKQE